MKLSEKIAWCRRRAGLSQEALAEQLGVSRQAVSKWETGDSEPELAKLRTLAGIFHVSADWLLSEEEPPEDAPQEAPAQSAPPRGDWVDRLPGALGRLFRRYGWLLGLWIALAGAGLLLSGGLARSMTRRMFSFGFPGGKLGGGIPELADFAMHNPVSTMGTVMMIVGGILLAGGVILALVLRKRRK